MIYHHPESSHGVIEESWNNMNISPQEAPAIHSESKLQAWKESTKDA